MHILSFVDKKMKRKKKKKTVDMLIIGLSKRQFDKLIKQVAYGRYQQTRRESVEPCINKQVALCILYFPYWFMFCLLYMRTVYLFRWVRTNTVLLFFVPKFKSSVLSN